MLTSTLGVFALLTGGVLAGAVPAGASNTIAVFVSYADSLRAASANFPTPWSGSPGTIFEGCKPVSACTYDGGAIRVVNNGGSTVTVNSITVHVDSCTYTGWPSARLSPGMDLIVTQLGSGAANGCSGPTPTQFDLSDVGPGGADDSGNCKPDSIQPTVEVTIDGVTTPYTDSGQVLNTGGVDAGACSGNESIQWTPIGSAPCNGSQLSLAPPTQTHPVLSTATVIATFTSRCANPVPLSNTAVAFAIDAGPNAGRTGAGVTDAQGQATFSYSSAMVGTDTLLASISNPAGIIPSNTVLANWTTSFAPGGGAFVIGSNEDHLGRTVNWWGAQWWKNNSMSWGPASASFKGFELSNASPWCGQTWTTRPGNSPHPPKSVPSQMAVIVSSHIIKTGATISGNIVHIVLVQTNPGYGPNPGHRGTGTIVDQIC